MDGAVSHKTLYVQGIPHSCSNDQLREVFSVAGPIRKCFVVKQKNVKEEDLQKQKFIGFVTYDQPESAKKAVNVMQSKFSVDGNQLKVSLAKTKRSLKAGKKHSQESTEDTDDVTKDSSFNNEDEAKNENASPESLPNANKSNKFPGTFTVALSGLPSFKRQDILKIFKMKKLAQPLHLSKSGDDDDEIHVVMSSKQSALKIISQLSGKHFGENLVKAVLVVEATSNDFHKSSKKSRLIIRNLSFQCSEKELTGVFEKYGKITDVKIPTKSDGKKLGFGFVQFNHIFEAAKAIEGINMTPVKGRKVAVDWSLPQEKYQEMVKTKQPENVKTDPGKRKDVISDDVDNENGDDSGLESGHLDGDTEDDDKDDVDMSEEDADDSNSSDAENSIDQDEEEDSNEDSGSDDDEEDVENIDSPKKSIKQSSDTNTKKGEAKKKDFSSDVHEGKTVFLRNLSFDVQEEVLEEELAKFGEIKYCKIVINQETGLSKGCAFVQFVSLEDAQNCLASLMDESTKLSLDGREIFASVALSRTDARKQVKQKEVEKEKEDKRNLFLANEGLIRPGTQAAIGLSEIELNKRRKIDAAKRLKLKNPNIFVSQTRLCVHNIPRAFDDVKLREVFAKAVKGGKITESRVMRDREKMNQEGVGRSFGFGFVNFTKHEHALAALREMNNNPEVFSASKRPIVEFSLENNLALAAKRQRRKRQLAKNDLKAKMRSSDGEAPEGKRSKRRERRKDAKFKNESNGNLGRKRAGNNAEGSAATKKQKPNPGEESSVAKRKSFQGSTGTTQSGKKLKMPKHTGPKIRKRDKGQVLERLRVSKKLNSSSRQANARSAPNSEHKNKRPKAVAVATTVGGSRRNRASQRDFKEDQEFSKLVAKYTNKFKANMGSEPRKPKWFQK